MYGCCKYVVATDSACKINSSPARPARATDDRGGGEAIAARRDVRGSQPDQGQAHRVRRGLRGDQLQRGCVPHGGRDQGGGAGGVFFFFFNFAVLLSRVYLYMYFAI